MNMLRFNNNKTLNSLIRKKEDSKSHLIKRRTKLNLRKKVLFKKLKPDIN